MGGAGASGGTEASRQGQTGHAAKRPDQETAGSSRLSAGAGRRRSLGFLRLDASA